MKTKAIASAEELTGRSVTAFMSCTVSSPSFVIVTVYKKNHSRFAGSE